MRTANGRAILRVCNCRVRLDFSRDKARNAARPRLTARGGSGLLATKIGVDARPSTVQSLRRGSSSMTFNKRDNAPGDWVRSMLLGEVVGLKQDPPRKGGEGVAG